MNELNIPDPDGFRIGGHDDGNLPDLFLLCPKPVGCDSPIDLQGPLDLDEVHNVIDAHIRAHHLPPPPEGRVYCVSCYNLAIAGWGPWCVDCRGE